MTIAHTIAALMCAPLPLTTLEILSKHSFYVSSKYLFTNL